MIRRTRVSAAAVTLATTLAGLTAGGAAFADEPSTDLRDPGALIGEIYPEILAETVALSVWPAGRSSASPGEASVTVDIPEDASHAVRVDSPDIPGSGQPLGIEVLGATGSSAVIDGVAVLSTDDEELVHYVQQTLAGVRFLAAVGDADAGSTFQYRLDVAPESKLISFAEDVTILVDENESYVATLEPAWARDSAGTSLPTHYELDGNISHAARGVLRNDAVSCTC